MPTDEDRGIQGSPAYAHISFHSMEPGQAASVHVQELFDAVERAGVSGMAVNRGMDQRPRIFSYASVLLQALRQLPDVDALYIRAHPAALPLLVAARFSEVTTIVEVNGTTTDMTDAYAWLRPAGALVALADRMVLRLADGVAAVSPGLRDWARTQGVKAPVAVIPNAADSRKFHPGVSPRAGLPRRYVAYCGALAPWQGLDTLIDATRHPHWPGDVRLVVAGAGPLRSQLRAARAAGAPIDDLGLLSHGEVPSVITGALAVVSPRSVRHASPMKLYEALACGQPVVASALPGQAELIEDRQCGLTFRPGDSADLAGAIAALAGDAGLRARLAASAEAVGAENTWDARARTLLTFVRKVAACEPGTKSASARR